MLTIGSRVRDLRTRLTGRVVHIIPQAEPWRDLIIIRLDMPDPFWGSIISAKEGEVEVLDGEATERGAI